MTVSWSGKAEGERRRLADAEAGEAGRGLSNSEAGVGEGMGVLDEVLGEEVVKEVVGSIL